MSHNREMRGRPIIQRRDTTDYREERGKLERRGERREERRETRDERRETRAERGKELHIQHASVSAMTCFSC
jgi:hypothetical protein